MPSNNKIFILLTLTGVAILGAFLFPPVAQPQSYHHFADTRKIWGIPNFLNVLTNFPFFITGAIGLLTVAKESVRPGIRAPYVMLFTGVLFTALGSAYYHWQPNNDTLVWDRVPMTIVFMSLLSATISEVWSQRLGHGILLPLIFIGLASVWWWHYTELNGNGDLRPYLLVQFYPAIFIPLLLCLFYRPGLKRIVHALLWVVFWYLIAKVFEQLDLFIYRFLPISGHSLKHLAAALSTWYFVVLFRRVRDAHSSSESS